METKDEEIQVLEQMLRPSVNEVDRWYFFWLMDSKT